MASLVNLTHHTRQIAHAARLSQALLTYMICGPAAAEDQPRIDLHTLVNR